MSVVEFEMVEWLQLFENINLFAKLGDCEWTRRSTELPSCTCPVGTPNFRH